MTKRTPHLIQRRHLRIVSAVCAILIIVLFCELLAANALLKPISRDEHMYCTAAVLMADGQLPYRDFSYPAQLPYHPLLLATVCKAFGTTHYLLAGRLVSLVSDVLIVLTIVGIYLHAFGGRRFEGLLFALAGIAFFVFNSQVDYAAGYAWNHDVVLLCVVLSLWLFITTDFLGRQWIWRIAAIGGLLTFASCMRITTVLVELLFFIAILVYAGGSFRKRLLAALPFSLTGLAVAVWPVWVCLQAPEAFRLNLVQIPALYGRWLYEQGMTHGKFTMTMFCLTSPEYLVLLAVAGYLLVRILRRRAQIEATARRNLIVTLSVALVFVVIAFIPPTMWQQYWALPVPFLVAALAYPLADLCRNAEATQKVRAFRIATWVVFIGATTVVAANWGFLRQIQVATVSGRWPPLVLHKASVDIVASAKAPGPILTLGPLYSLEGGGGIYRELASGSVVYRIADSLSAAERAATHTVGPKTLHSLVGSRPPTAIVLGVEPDNLSFLEEPLEEQAGANWSVQTYQPGIRALFRP